MLIYLPVISLAIIVLTGGFVPNCCGSFKFLEHTLEIMTAHYTSLLLQEFEFFQNLEMHMRVEYPPLCGRDHLAYRSYYFPVKVYLLTFEIKSQPCIRFCVIFFSGHIFPKLHLNNFYKHILKHFISSWLYSQISVNY